MLAIAIPSIGQLVFADEVQPPAELGMGTLLRWHDPRADEVVLCFKLEPKGDWDYGELIVSRAVFAWEQFEGKPTFELTEAELADSDLHLRGSTFWFANASIIVEEFFDTNDVARATITGQVENDTTGQRHDFRIQSPFHLVRPEKYAEKWQARFEESMRRALPDFTLERHFTEPSDYGLRYGDGYFSEFKNADGDSILIQLDFDSSDVCDLFIALPDDPNIESQDRTFPFTGPGFKQMTVFLNRTLGLPK